MQPPRPGVKYTAVQIAEMRREYPNFTMPGYHMRLEDGLFSFIPWTEATDPMNPRGFKFEGDFVAPPIKKRTPQERVESLAKHLADAKAMGGVPGVSDEFIRERVRESWRKGQPFTEEDARALAASLLNEAERKVVPTND